MSRGTLRSCCLGFNFHFLSSKAEIFYIGALFDNFQVHEVDDIEDEGEEDKGDAAEDPGGEGSETNRVGGSRPKSRDEKIYKHL